MPSPSEQVSLNLAQARDLRANGRSYREIGQQLALTTGQLAHIRRTLKREKAARTRLRTAQSGADERDLPVSQSVLPAGLRQMLTASGLRTLGDLADRLADPDLPGLEAMPGIGPHRARLVDRVLDHYGLRSGPSDLRAEIERLFPDLREPNHAN